jgi:hypothetical protein
MHYNVQTNTKMQNQHRLWAECAEVVDAFSMKYFQYHIGYAAIVQTMHPLHVIGALFDISKKYKTLERMMIVSRIQEEVAKAERNLGNMQRTVEDLIAMFYVKGYISLDCDPLDIAALSLIARRTSEDAIPILCRLFLKPHFRGSSSKLVSDAFGLKRQSSRPEECAKNVQMCKKQVVEEYDPTNAMLPQFMLKPLPPPSQPPLDFNILQSMLQSACK